MHQSLVDVFYVVSQALLTPVMLALVVGMMLVVIMFGQAAREAIERWTLGRKWRTFLHAVREGEAAPRAWPQAAKVGLVGWFARQPGATTTEGLRLLLPDGELRANRHLGRFQVLIRVGPMLGLIGTLIPLGPALQGLSLSNLSEVGDNLNVAFTTTVFGIAVGGAAYALYILHRAWYDCDLCDLEYLLALLEENQHDDEASAPLESRERRRSAGRHGQPV